jgi:hypothetical protein
MKPNYSIEDFRTGRNIRTEAKIFLWREITRKCFGSVECLEKKFNNCVDQDAWRSEHLDGMQKIMHYVTGNKYENDECMVQEVKTVSGTMAGQFKSQTKKIIEILKDQTSLSSPNLNQILKESNSVKVSNKSNKTDFIFDVINNIKMFSPKEQSDIVNAIRSTFS